MGLLVRAACLVLAGWFEGPAALAARASRASGLCCGCLCRALRQFAKSLQGAEPESRGRKAGRTFLQHSLGPRERPLLDYCSDSYDTSMCYLGIMRSWHKTAASHAKGNDLQITET